MYFGGEMMAKQLMDRQQRKYESNTNADVRKPGWERAEINANSSGLCTRISHAETSATTVHQNHQGCGVGVRVRKNFGGVGVGKNVPTLTLTSI
jgi:hypothetical protein